MVNNKWFDKECNTARVKLRNESNLKHRNPADKSIRQSYHESLKQFRSLLKIRKKLS